MVAIAVAAAIITYVWSMGLLGGLMGSGGSQTKEQLILEAYDWTTATPRITLRNVGSSHVTVATIYIEGNAWLTTASTVSLGAAAPFSGAQPGGMTFQAGASYVIKVISTTGGTFSFSIIKGKAA